MQLNTYKANIYNIFEIISTEDFHGSMKSLDMEQLAICEYVNEGILVARNADAQGILEAKITELKT